MKKLIIVTFILAILTATLSPLVSADFLGSAGAVLANDVKLIKTGLLGERMVFSDTDFKTALGIAEFGSVTVKSLPESGDGTLMLSGRRVSEGQVIKRRSIPSLVFIPESKKTTEARFTFSVDGGSSADMECILKFIDRVNYAPKIKEGTEGSLSVTTQSGISVFGRISASDPEGDAIEYMIVTQPKYGILTVNGENGEFKYLPGEGFQGKDSFVFVLRDEYGNFSEPSSVSVKITERMSDVVFVDMLESKSYNAAVSMSAMGIMSGSRVGDDMYFLPEEGVTRAEFVAMAMKALSIRADDTLTSTYFDDNDKIPRSLVSYVATAARCGIVNGAFDGSRLNFRPNDIITRCEAAIIMSNLLEVKSESAVFSTIDGIETVPVWARGHVGAMVEVGIFDEDEELNMNEPLCRETVAEYLYRMMLKK
ncbi:MAG: S-layer homology domain-containing protein [Clostridia bacterium]|nr:S-layer homology domain-containing protein [Clostridia bacterium]